MLGVLDRFKEVVGDGLRGGLLDILNFKFSFVF